jgi:hypothetical protein
MQRKHEPALLPGTIGVDLLVYEIAQRLDGSANVVPAHASYSQEVVGSSRE